MGMLITFICGLVVGGIVGFITGIYSVAAAIKEGKTKNIKYLGEK